MDGCQSIAAGNKIITNVSIQNESAEVPTVIKININIKTTAKVIKQIFVNCACGINIEMINTYCHIFPA